MQLLIVGASYRCKHLCDFELQLALQSFQNNRCFLSWINVLSLAFPTELLLLKVLAIIANSKMPANIEK